GGRRLTMTPPTTSRTPTSTHTTSSRRCPPHSTPTCYSNGKHLPPHAWPHLMTRCSHERDVHFRSPPAPDRPEHHPSSHRHDRARDHRAHPGTADRIDPRRCVSLELDDLPGDFTPRRLGELRSLIGPPQRPYRLSQFFAYPDGQDESDSGG